MVAGSDVWSFSGIDLGATETDWDMTYGLCICTKLHCLNEWGRTRGDVFHIVDRGVEVVEYGPKNEHGEFAYRGLVGKMSHAPAANVAAARVPVAMQQDDAILNWLKSNKYDPLKLPVPPSGKAGVKKHCRDAVKFSSASVFNTAWDRLRANGEIQDAK